MNWLHLFGINGSNSRLFANNGQDWYSQNEFSEILKREQHRGERNRLPSSFILIDLSKCLESKDQIRNGVYKIFLKKLIVVLTDYSKEYDIKCFHNPYNIEILLLDASLNDAKTFIEKIVNELHDYFQSSQITAYKHFIESTRFSSFPINHSSIYEKIEIKPVLQKNHTATKEPRRKTKAQFLNEGYTLQFKLNRKKSTNGTSTVNLPIHWYYLDDLSVEKMSKTVKRIMDICGSLLGIFIFFPLIILTALIIKITSNGPVLFRQKRVGYLGKPFELFKFRTMYNISGENNHENYVKGLIDRKLNSEDIISYKYKIQKNLTGLGKFLRKISLDELPQLFNILKGEMSIVGPRPHPYYEVQNYKSWFSHRLEIKPGLTGLSKLLIRDSADNYWQAMRLDIWYLKNWSIFIDIKIIAKTIKCIFSNNGAE